MILQFCVCFWDSLLEASNNGGSYGRRESLAPENVQYQLFYPTEALRFPIPRTDSWDAWMEKVINFFYSSRMNLILSVISTTCESIVWLWFSWNNMMLKTYEYVSDKKARSASYWEGICHGCTNQFRSQKAYHLLYKFFIYGYAWCSQSP